VFDRKQHYKERKRVMPEPKKTKAGGKDDGNTPKKPTPEELAKLAEEKPMSGLIPAMIEQDRLDGLPEDHQPYVEPDADDDNGDSDRPGADEALQTELSEDEPSGAAYAEESERAATPNAGPEAATSSAEPEERGDTPVESESDEKTPSSTNHKVIVRGINERVHRCIDTGIFEIADFSLDSIYAGNITAALSSGRKPLLFRLTADDPELGMDPRRLAEIIGIGAIRRDLVQAGQDVSGLSASKLGALLPVKDANLRRQLAREAVERNYTVRQIKDLVKGFTPRKVTEDIGKTIMKKIGGPLQMLDDEELFTVCGDKERLLKDLSKAEREKILERIREGKPRLKALDALVESLEKALEAIEEES
jgi:hypothetical protein